MVDREGPDDGVLGEVRVLVLVDQDVAEPGVEVGADVGVLLEDRDDVDEQVVEVDGRRLAEPLLVAGVDLGGDGRDVVAGRAWPGPRG